MLVAFEVGVAILALIGIPATLAPEVMLGDIDTELEAAVVSVENTLEVSDELTTEEEDIKDILPIVGTPAYLGVGFIDNEGVSLTAEKPWGSRAGQMPYRMIESSPRGIDRKDSVDVIIQS